jgi:hypothetical protein
VPTATDLDTGAFKVIDRTIPDRTA